MTSFRTNDEIAEAVKGLNDDDGLWLLTRDVRRLMENCLERERSKLALNFSEEDWSMNVSWIRARLLEQAMASC
jgi:hypothetical protein